MASRGHIPSAHGRSVQVSGMMRHGSLPHLEALQNKFDAQAAEIEQLAGDNRRLAATHVALRQELMNAQDEIEGLRAHIGSIQAESDIQIRILLDKIAKMEKDIKAGESLKKDLHEAHMEAQDLVRSKQDLTTQIQRATQELDEARADIKKLPEMHSEMVGLVQEHQRLRTTFQYEKGLNVEKVEQMCAMERELMGMAREVERLRTEVLKVESIGHAPNAYGNHYMNPDPFYAAGPFPVHGPGGYPDTYGRFHAPLGVGAGGEGVVLYGKDNSAAAPPPPSIVHGSAAAPSGGVGAAGSVGSYVAPHAHQ